MFEIREGDATEGTGLAGIDEEVARSHNPLPYIRGSGHAGMCIDEEASHLHHPLPPGSPCWTQRHQNNRVSDHTIAELCAWLGSDESCSLLGEGREGGSG